MKKNLTSLLSLFLTLFLSGQIAIAQKSPKVIYKKVENVTGKYELFDNITPEEAKEKARLVALKNALEKAGVPTQVTSFGYSSSSQVNDKINEQFIQSVNANKTGRVIEKDVKYRKFEKDGRTYYEATIAKAKVQIDKVDRDKTFDALIEGAKVNYNHQEEMNFTILPSKDAHLYIFVISKHQNALIVPDGEYEKKVFLKADKKRTMPNPSLYDGFLMEANQKQEVQRLLVVLTKEKYPYYCDDNPQGGQSEDASLTQKHDNTTFGDECILQWIYSIPADQRCVKMLPVVIRK